MPGCLHCFAQDSLLIELLKQHRYKVSLSNGTLEGEGAQWLKKEAADAQFILIGEDHGLAQPPQLTAAVFKMLHPAGFRYFVSETGPSSIKLLTPMVAGKDQHSLVSFFRQHPMAFAFYPMQEEAQMLKEILQTTRYAENTVWGIDQEFIMSPGAYLHHLAKQKWGKESRLVLEQYVRRTDAEMKDALETKDFSKLSMQTLTAEDFEILRTAVKSKPEAVSIINNLERSQEIYQLFGTSGYTSNLVRIQLMKDNLMKHYRQAQAAGNAIPRAVFKFGATHMYRGQSFLGFYDIGNLASELAASNGMTSLHILIAGNGGTVNNWRLINDVSTQKSPYSGKEALKELGISPLYSLMDKKEWQLIDLEPAREMIYNGRIKNINQQLRKIIWGYDAILLIPEVSASTNL
ncbi:hypothetical protein D770_16795 [Flammeovirgaceae bacterium 311]|nr:hypothetical protein D770_16795 [Flammeovirgaceae bacterium 311]